MHVRLTVVAAIMWLVAAMNAATNATGAAVATFWIGVALLVAAAVVRRRQSS